MQQFLNRWRADVNAELHTNSRGFLQHKHPSLNLPPSFPDMKVLGNYAAPAFRCGGGAIRDTEDLSLPQIAGFCEVNFTEWGHTSAIIKRFRDLLWEAAVVRVLRRAALEADRKEVDKKAAAGEGDLFIRGPLRPSRVHAVGTPASLVNRYLSKAEVDRIAGAFVNQGPSHSHRADSNTCDTRPLILRVVGTRQHVSTDGMLEYRVEVSPAQLVALTRSGIKGIHRDPSNFGLHVDDDFEDMLGTEPQKMTRSPKKSPPDPESPMRMWLPASMMWQVHPGLIEDFEATGEARKAKNIMVEGKGEAVNSSSGAERGSTAKPRLKSKRKAKLQESGSGPHPVSQPSADAPAHQDPCVTSLEPWFPTQDIAGLSSLSGRGFLFTFPNPDNPTIPETMDASAESVDLDDGERAENQSQDFDTLFDEIMGLCVKSSNRQEKAIARQKRSRLAAIGSEVVPTEDDRASKRQKYTSSKPFSLCNKAPRSEWCVFPLPSSQDSGMVQEDDEMVIDLT
jgi:hypothetical protein